MRSASAAEMLVAFVRLFHEIHGSSRHPFACRRPQAMADQYDSDACRALVLALLLQI
jgi:hypothetical protein